MNSIGPTGGSAASRGRRRALSLAATCAVVLVACSPVRKSPPAPTPRSRPAPVVVAPAASPAYSERTLPAARAQAIKYLARNGAGAMAPAETGYFLDVLQGRILQLSSTRYSVTRRGDALVIRMGEGGGVFAADDGIGADGSRALTTLGAVLGEFRRSVVIVRAGGNDAMHAGQRSLSAVRALAAAGVDRRRLLPVAAPDLAQPLEIQVEPVVASR